MAANFSQIDDFFAIDGPLAKHFPTYKPRNSQIAMAKAVEKSINNCSTLVCEAGTGIGKTYGYLVPILLQYGSQRPQIVISTGTKNLQDQLFYRDLPALLDAINQPLSYCQIKGRSNYLCLYNLEQAFQYPPSSQELVASLQMIRQQHSRSRSGEISEFKQIAEQSYVWKMVTSTSDDCMAQECDYFDECYLYQARDKALYSDIIVVNHHLLVSDLLLKQQEKTAILPSYDACVVDEAHQLADIAGGCFSKKLSSYDIKDFLNDCLKSNRIEAGEGQKLPQQVELIQNQLDEISFYFIHHSTGQSWDNIKKMLESPWHDLVKMIRRLLVILEMLRVVGKRLNHCFNRAENLIKLISEILSDSFNHEEIVWYEVGRKGFTIYQTPVNFSHTYQQISEHDKVAWIYTSATLSSLNNFVSAQEQQPITGEIAPYFDFFRAQLGLRLTDYLSLSSPFDYRKQMLWYQVNDIPEPQHIDHIPQLVSSSLPLIKRLKGRTFFLFTSYKAMREAYQVLSQYGFNILLQGQLPKQQMLEQFVQMENSILLGTYSFWQGVDVAGTALCCVIIEKLPFASPYEPITAARIERLKNNQCDPFYSYQVPQAIIQFKQGIGRLIRSVSDFGVLIIGDRRLYSKSYGKMFRDVLPQIHSTSHFHVVEQFLNHHEQGLEH